MTESRNRYRADLLALPTDWRLVRVGRHKEPIAGDNWFDADNFSGDEAAGLPGSGPPAWGLKSGPVSGVVVLDLDAEGWRESFQQQTCHPITDLPTTIGWTSGKPGRSGHAFQVDPDWWPHLVNRRCWANANGRTYWELRGDRHQSVILGAHPETSGYRWLPGRSPVEIPDPAAAPDWLLEALLVQELPNLQPLQSNEDDAARAAAMLEHLPAADYCSYDSWLRVGMALHHTDPGLLADWVIWCKAMPNFDEAECLAKWKSFGKGHKGQPATIATLHHLAKQHGYREPRRSRKPDVSQKHQKTHPAAAAGEHMAAQQQEAGASPMGQRSDPDLTYRELLAAALKAVRQGDDDAEMAARAEIMARFKRTDAAITESLFKLLTEQEGGATTAPAYRSVNLAQVHPIEWQLEGFIPANDLTLLWGQAGAGKTTAALALAFAVVDGIGFLDRDRAATPGRVLFIASDSGASPLLTALHSIGLADHPANAPGEGQRFFVWAHDADQGALAWDASLRGCLALLQTVKQERIDLVVADSCKAITAKAGLSYTDNGQVAALLTFIKEVICRHCSVLLLNHDGTQRGEAAGAKAWKEIPSAVHCIETVLEANEQTTGEQRSGIESRDLRRWVVKKCRVPGVAREFRFFLNHDAGQLELCPEVERVSDCRAAITEVVSQSWKNGEPTLARGEIVSRCWARWGYSQKSVDNSLSEMVAAKHPEVVRAAKRGHYRLAPRMVQALSQYTSLSEGKKQGEIVVTDRVLGTSLQVPEGTQRKLSEYPRETRRNSTNPSLGDGSDQVPSLGAEMAIGNGSVPVVDESISETTEIRRQTPRPEGQSISADDHRTATTTTDWVRLALRQLGLAPHVAMVSRVMAWLEQTPEQPACTRSAVTAAMARLQEEDNDNETAAQWAA
jgi:archaellum biogenesis ATPase FlaH